MRQKLLLLTAVFFGILAFMFTYMQINQERKNMNKGREEVYLIGMQKFLGEGDTITEDSIRPVKTVRFKAEMEQSLDIQWKDRERILGREVQIPIAEGAFLNWNYLKSTISSGRDGLSRLVRPGYRAVSIQVDATSSVTGLVQPNNYVDLIGTFRFPDRKGDAAYDTVTLTILQRVRVLATGTDIGIQSGPGVRSGSRSYSTVTLELTPKEVEMIIFATQKGRLTLSLRSYEDVQITHDTQSIDWDYLKDNIGKYTAEREEKLKTR